MGNKLKANNANSKVGRPTECPMCGEILHKNSTYSSVNNHIDNCMKDPTKAEAQKRERQLEKDFSKMKAEFSDIRVRRDTLGNKKVESNNQSISLSRAKELAKMDPSSVQASFSTREKMIWFKHMIDKNTVKPINGTLKLQISRETILIDTIEQVSKADNIRKVLDVTFLNEISSDAGGVSREYFTTLMKEFMSEDLGLFIKANTEEFSYKVNVDLTLGVDYLNLYYIFGKCLAKALFDRIPVNICLNRSIFNALLGKTSENVYEGDLKTFALIDFNTANSLEFFVENDLTQFEDIIEQYFVTNAETTAGQNQGENEVELMANGRQTRVTNDNKMLFIKKKCHFIAYLQQKNQLEQIRKGFYEVIPLNWINKFNPDELEAIICGQASIDLKDWKSHSNYKGFSANDSTINHFWSCLETYNQEQLGRILQFCTGTSRVPLGGFSALESNHGVACRFEIQKIQYNSKATNQVMENLPRAHTCFNRLDLPHYKQYDKLKQCMDVIANEDIPGFGIE